MRNFFDTLYVYAWFLGFFVAGGLYYGLMRRWPGRALLSPCWLPRTTDVAISVVTRYRPPDRGAAAGCNRR